MLHLTALLETIDVFVALASLDYTKVWGPYQRSNHEGDLRQIVIVQDSTGKKRTISYPKYLTEMRLDRQLAPNETVDHKDGNILNNEPDNLQVLDRAFHSALDTRRVKLVEFQCAMCGEKFKRSPRLVRDKAKKNKAGPFCSRHCSGLYARKRQLGLHDDISHVQQQQHVPSEYYKNKHLAELATHFLTKYGSAIQ